MSVVVFDVNETLSDMRPLADRFADLGADGDLWRLWFAVVLRDGFARTAAGAPAHFGSVAAGALPGLLAGTVPAKAIDDAVAHVIDGFAALQVHDDVPDGVRALAHDGHRLVTLSNGGVSVGERLLAGAGIRDLFEAVLSVDDAGAWKPHPRAYAYAGRVCGVEPAGMTMVAVHPWDIDGAARAGMRTAWIDRSDGSAAYPPHFLPPTTVAGAVGGLALLLS